MYYSYVEIEYVATSFSPAKTDLALKLLIHGYFGKFNYFIQPHVCSRIVCAHNLIMRILLIMHVGVSPAFVYCMLAFLQHLFLQFSYFVHVQC